MHVTFQPVAGATIIRARIDETSIVIDGKVIDFETLPLSGAVRLDVTESDPPGVIGVIVEYGEEGGVSTCLTTDLHTVEVIPSTAPPAPQPAPPKEDTEVEALAHLLALRESWTCRRWQIITVLGRDLWQAILDFAASDAAPWGLKAVIEAAVDIPRVSQTVDLLAYILGLSDDDVDAYFRAAMELRA